MMEFPFFSPRTSQPRDHFYELDANGRTRVFQDVLKEVTKVLEQNLLHKYVCSVVQKRGEVVSGW